MTRFQDGPAKGQNLMLHRSPKFLRVTEEEGVFDALDEPNDIPRPAEKLYAYERVKNEGMVHINRGRKGGGFYPVSEYRMIANQPSEEVMRSNVAWNDWINGMSPGAKSPTPA